ncbi:transporter substrate-binding domain-containing protein [Kocuria sediminis]|uniref:Transporter substrate-binding domain-containing protein n=1 Tax=Kocuria sediminis TaxID=1038857 RepID=A0A6N8GLW9_9MICC|nr:ABC transporter substrate-binding protein [Kocuria sediminis]MUN62253.1 transporter substrate-binding domain-containing protein [Kocuria sediminis]
MPRPSRRRAAGLLSVAAALTLTACSGGAPEDTAAEPATPVDGGSAAVALVEPGFLTVCSESNYPPFEMEQDGEMVGLDMDLGREIAADLGVEMKNVTLAFESIQSGAALDTDQCDVAISALSITEERRTVMDFSDPYYDNEVGLVTDGEDGVDSIDAAREEQVRVGVMQGTVGETQARELGLNAVQFEDATTLFTGLSTGSVDAVLDDVTAIAEHAQDDPDFVVQETADLDDQLGVAVQKGDAAMLQAVDATLDRIEEDGTLEQIVEQWIPVQEKD